MSLINKMLQDLDGRHATDQERDGLHRDVRPVAAPIPRRRPGPLIWGTILVAGAGSAAAWLALTPKAAPTPPVVLAAAPPAPPTLVSPAPAPAAEPAAGAAIQAVPLPPPPTVAAVSVAPNTVLGDARLAAAPDSEVGPKAAVPAAAGSGAPSQGLNVRAPQPGRATAPAKIAPEERQEPESPSLRPPAVVKPKSPAVSSEGAMTPTPSPGVAAVPPAPGGKASAKEAVRGGGATVSVAAGPEKIEKSLRLATPRDRAEQEYRLAVQSLNGGRVPEALERLRGALRQDPTHTTSRQLLVRLLLEQRATDEARQVLSDGLESNPGQVAWAVALARLQAGQGEVGAALATLQKWAAAGQEYADYQGLYGNLLARQNRSREAAERYLAAARLNPGEGRWWLGLGLAMEADGRGGEARGAFARARSAGNLPPELAALAEQRLR